MEAGVAAFGAVAEPAASDVTSCQAACLVTPECVAIDTDSDSGVFCWIHTSFVNLETQAYFRPSVVQYRVVECPGMFNLFMEMTTMITFSPRLL